MKDFLWISQRNSPLASVRSSSISLRPSSKLENSPRHPPGGEKTKPEAGWSTPCSALSDLFPVITHEVGHYDRCPNTKKSEAKRLLTVIQFFLFRILLLASSSSSHEGRAVESQSRPPSPLSTKTFLITKLLRLSPSLRNHTKNIHNHCCV